MLSQLRKIFVVQKPVEPTYTKVGSVEERVSVFREETIVPEVVFMATPSDNYAIFFSRGFVTLFKEGEWASYFEALLETHCLSYTKTDSDFPHTPRLGYYVESLDALNKVETALRTVYKLKPAY